MDDFTSVPLDTSQHAGDVQRLSPPGRRRTDRGDVAPNDAVRRLAMAGIRGGSALYTVPFRLSKPVSHDWAAVFEHVWNHPPQFTSMHRPGIAHARGNRIVLNGTTIDEVQRVHRETLILCVKETNRVVAEQRDEKAGGT